MSQQHGIIGAKGGWYGGFGGGSLWMIWLFGRIRVELVRALAAVLAIVANIALIVYLPPWKHPNVPIWKSMLVMFGFQFVAVSVSVAVMSSADPSQWRYTVHPFALCLLPFTLNCWSLGRKTWNEINGESKPLKAYCDELV